MNVASVFFFLLIAAGKDKRNRRLLSSPYREDHHGNDYTYNFFSCGASAIVPVYAANIDMINMSEQAF